ncbi:MAG: beta-galactosidase [Candidatus Hydrogenedentes bacterium]|nr:beta-galactosidase [Candidatus Hydrogenedentota bacterium]
MHLSAPLRTSFCVCVAWALFGQFASADGGAGFVSLFDAGSRSASKATLRNAESLKATERAKRTVFEAAPETDPYEKGAWEFDFTEPFPNTWERLVLEIEFFDEGAGVIQPLLLQDDSFSGKWLRPSRSVSFTRLNTKTYRRAYFEFDAAPPDSGATKNPHLRISGLQYLRAIRARRALSDSQWHAAEKSVPSNVEPMLVLQRPMQINCTVGIPDVGNPPSLAVALENIREYAPLARLLGFTSVECFVRWDLLEPREGEFDFTHYDTLVSAIQKRGLKWFPNLVITSAFSLPGWYYESGQHNGLRCLEHDQMNQVPTIWNDDTRKHVIRVLSAFGHHYEAKGVLEAVRLGPSGNFGEAQYPAGAGRALGYRGEPMHAHIGWWAGDAFAQTSFQEFLRTRYATVDALNAAWGDSATSFEQISPRLPETYVTRRGRLDMTEWYTDSMTRWCDFWAEAARAAMPNTPIYMSSGGWGFREAGTDFTAQAESMKKHGGGIRLTNETDSFEQNVYATRLAATAARLYGIPLGYEPAGYHSGRGTVARFFNTITTNGANLYTRHSVLFEDSFSVDRWIRDYPNLDRRADPVIEVALYYPETMNQLDDGTFRHLYAWGFNSRAAEIRRRVDVDFLDERLIRAGYLERYRVLVFCWGNTIEDDVQRTIDAWIRQGGTAIYPTYPRGPQETVEGDQSRFLAWERGDTGAGTFRRFKGDMEPVSLYGDFVEEVLQGVGSLSPLTRQVLAIQHPEQVYFSVLADGSLVALNYGDKPAPVSLEGRFTETIMPYSFQFLPLE